MLNISNEIYENEPYNYKTGINSPPAKVKIF